MEIWILNQQTALVISEEQVQKLVKEVITYEKQDCDEVAIHFVATPVICELHGHYFDDPTPTDCISFPVPRDTSDAEEYHTIGDVFVCTDVALAYATEHGLDPYTETALYIIHGLLHLMGYDDISEEDRVQMRSAEERHMKNLQNQSLLLHK